MYTRRVVVSVVLVFLIGGSAFIPCAISNTGSSEEIDVQEYERDWYVHHEGLNNNEHSSSFIKNEGLYNNVVVEPIGESMDGPMDSAWPMFGHDIVHTCRSQFSTMNNLGAELWRVHGDSVGAVYGSAIIDSNGIVYFGTKGSDSSLYALYPNGTRKWRYHSYGLLWGTPSLAENGDIYCTKWGDSYLRAVTKNGTLRWLFNQEASSASSSTIGPDGTIYFGTDGYKIFAVNPNGTEKWRYSTGYIVMGAPTIGVDGTIYIGSGDRYLYALYPNGTLQWRFPTGGEIKGSASIAPESTIYVPSFDGYLYAINPNGTLKWRATTGNYLAAAGTAQAPDGTIYVGTETLRAYYPNGTLKWVWNTNGSMCGTVPAVSADGTIYVSASGSIVAVNPDGTQKWRKRLTIAEIHSSPIIGPDDRVYVGSEDYGLSPYGYLHAFGLGPLRAEAYGPYTGAMTEPLQFTGEAFGGTPPYIAYHWDFGDGLTSDEQNPTHIYDHRGNYTTTLTVTDSTGNHSSDTTHVTIGYPLPNLTVTKPVNALYIANLRICKLPAPIVFGRITFKVEASQVDADIDRVEFYYDGDLQYTDTAPPYKWLWTGKAQPHHQNFLIRVYDTRGNKNEDMVYITKII